MNRNFAKIIKKKLITCGGTSQNHIITLKFLEIINNNIYNEEKTKETEFYKCNYEKIQ